VHYVATGRGIGFVYFPELDGSSLVARIDVVGPQIPVVLVVAALAIVALDVVLRIRLRKYVP
jgi:hypothetical protein